MNTILKELNEVLIKMDELDKFKDVSSYKRSMKSKHAWRKYRIKYKLGNKRKERLFYSLDRYKK